MQFESIKQKCRVHQLWEQSGSERSWFLESLQWVQESGPRLAQKYRPHLTFVLQMSLVAHYVHIKVGDTHVSTQRCTHTHTHTRTLLNLSFPSSLHAHITLTHQHFTYSHTRTLPFLSFLSSSHAHITLIHAHFSSTAPLPDPLRGIRGV